MQKRVVVRATYMWSDGQRPTPKLRNKERPLYVVEEDWREWKELVNTAIQVRLQDSLQENNYGRVPKWVPIWGFDGSSTFQAPTESSDLKLVPVYVIPDPVLGDPNIMVLCEVLGFDDKPHPSNTRAVLRETVLKFDIFKPVFGLEQEYTLFDKDGIWPLRWPQGGGYPEPQGNNYCGVGSDEVFGRELVDAHTEAMKNCGLKFDGTNAEAMPSQWEFQIGPISGISAADELILSRFILYRLGEQFGITVKLSPKPVVGDWNGAGLHTNFSTKEMRQQDGIDVILEACERLRRFHNEHIWVYGEHNIDRLTGKHETCRIDQFRFAVADRGSSNRISSEVEVRKCGYLEDRRAAANADPYMVCTALLKTICGSGFDHRVFGYFFDESVPACWKHAVIMRGLFGK